MFHRCGAIIKNMSATGKQSAFTIVELLIVIVVIGILAAITIVAYNGLQSRAHNSALQANVKQAATSIETLKDTQGNYPSTVSSSQLPSSPNITYDYQKIGEGFCVTATDTSVGSYFATNTGTTSVGPCPVGYWPLDGTADDKSPYQNNGTIQWCYSHDGPEWERWGRDGVQWKQYITIPSKSYLG